MKIEHKFADYLDKDSIGAIEAIEKETGTRILAYYTPPAPAHLTEEQLKKIEALEKKLCVRLVAYSSH
jgi:hypothetical protein